MAQEARANFILARVAIVTGHPDVAISDFQKTIATSKEPRLLAWSHIYLGRMLDLDCNRDQAVTEYQAALAARDGQQDTRLAAERGVKTAYAVKGHSCEDDADDTGPAPPAKPVPPSAKAHNSLSRRSVLHQRSSLKPINAVSVFREAACDELSRLAMRTPSSSASALLRAERGRSGIV